MLKEALLFPGQGLPVTDLIACYASQKESAPKPTEKWVLQLQGVLDNLHGSAKFNVMQTLEDELSPSYQNTAFVQPIIYALSVTAYELSRERFHPSFVAGHSLGEYSALTAAGVMSLEQGMEIVAHKGKFTQEACDLYKSKLVSITGLTLEQVTDTICKKLDKVEIALVNGPLLIVVGCAAAGVSSIKELAESQGAKRIRELPTAGAFHTSYMQEVVTGMSEVLSQQIFNKVQIPIVANLDGKVVVSGDVYPIANLLGSLTRPVQWAESLETLQACGVDNYFEVGPGNSLRSLARLNGIDSVNQ